MYTLPEMDPLNLNFEACGIETLFFATNIGSSIWLTYINLFIAILSLAFYTVECVWKRLGNSYYWNGLIRIFMSVYQDFAMLAFLNLYKVEWRSGWTSQTYSYVISVISSVLVITLPPLFVVLLYRKRA